MIGSILTRQIVPPLKSNLSERDYETFLTNAWNLISSMPQFVAQDEDINLLELAHLVPQVPETVLAIYIGINDAVCNKGLVAPFLVRHAHNNVFVFDPAVYGGSQDVPSGTIDAKCVLAGFEPPNKTWYPNWTYVMIQDPARSVESLWCERGYIDTICAKFEDLTMLSNADKAKVCFFIDPGAFEHPVNKNRAYLKAARDRGQKFASDFIIPKGLEGEIDGLEPVILRKAEKLYVACHDFAPCAHAWSNIHRDCTELAVVNENSAVPLDLVVKKPSVNPKYSKTIPPKGSADMTTDWFYRGTKIVRNPLLQGIFKG